METSRQPVARRYIYNGESHATERDMIMHMLDEFRCTEAFGAEYVPLWLATSDDEWVRGGLRVAERDRRRRNGSSKGLAEVEIDERTLEVPLDVLERRRPIGLAAEHVGTALRSSEMSHVLRALEDAH